MAKIDTRKHIGVILLNKGIITEEQLDEAMEILDKEPPSSDRRLGQILYQDLGLDRHAVMKSIANIYAFSEVYEDQEEIDQGKIDEVNQYVDELPEEVVDELVHRKAIPFEKSRDSLTIATADPADPSLNDLVSRLNFKKVGFVYCRLELIDDLLSKVYEERNEFLDLLDEMEYEEAEIPDDTDEQVDEEEIDAEINQSMLNSLVEGMLVEGVRRGVSDIHMVPSGKVATDIRFRTDGKLHLWHQQENVKPEALSAVVKDKTRNVDRFERDKSQDGFIQRVVDNHHIRYRVSIMPIVGQQFDRKFESIVIRILDDRKVIKDLNKLGLQKNAYDDFVKAISKPSGIVIITGPTGSGKSTTLVAALYYVNEPELNVLTVEDPVEYMIDDARQLKIGPSMSFEESIRGILRHDPDIVLVGEIRDLETAQIAIKLANTGHLTFSTLHTNDAPSAVSRLYKMGVEPFLIANAVNLVMAQRLIRTLCKNCKREMEDLNPEFARSLGFSDEEIENTTFYEAVGCEKCNDTGYKGRSAIMEALYFTQDISDAILQSGDDIDEEAIKRMAMKNGMLSLRGSGRERIKSGITTLEEIAAVTLEDEE